MNTIFKKLTPWLDKAYALNSALVLFEWDDATEAPEEAAEMNAKTVEILSTEYYKTIINDEDAYRFSKLPYKNKIGFYYKPIELEGIICLSGWQDSKIRYDYAWDFKRYVRTMVDLKSKAMLSYPILDLFSDESIECRY